MVEATTVKEAANELHEDLRTTHYHVRKYVRLGILEETGARRRAGRPMKTYRAVAEGFFIPREHFPGGDRVESVTRLLDPTIRDMNRDSVAAVEPVLPEDSGRHVTMRNGVLGVDAGRDPIHGMVVTADFYARDEVPAVWLALEEFALDADAAKELQRELIALTQRLHAVGTPGGKGRRRYRLLVHFSPRRGKR